MENNSVRQKKVVVNDQFFLSLAEMSHYNISPSYVSYNEYVGKWELYFYRVVGMFLNYTISYLIRPSRILRSVKSFFREDSSTVAEQRLKDHLRKSAFFTKFIKLLF